MPTEKRAVVRQLVAAHIKPFWACVLVGLPKSSWHDRPQPRQDSELRQQIHDLARRFPRRGYRFIHALLARGGVIINKKRVRRVWREEGLAIEPKASRKIRTGEQFRCRRSTRVMSGRTISSLTRPWKGPP
ncbi:IS3 family transposase [Deinococcus aerolatus]|uniref:IS3 family transposase n=1 Tax=Deinococcus aerolatus TaxID=522487 RepID=UPI00166D323B